MISQCGNILISGGTITIEAYDDAIGYDALSMLTHTMLRDLASDAGQIEIQAPFFRTKSAPVSGIKSLMDYDVTLSGEYADGNAYTFEDEEDNNADDWGRIGQLWEN